MRDAVVVGAGVGGLCAAIALASRGWRTTVVEAAEDVGGKAGVAVVDGVRFDTGPSLLTLPHHFDRVLGLAGTRLEDEVELVRPDPVFRYHWPDGVVLDVARELDATLACVREALGPRAEQELATFLAYARRIWEAAEPRFVLGPAPRLSALFAPSAWSELHAVDPLRTMVDGIDSRVHDPKLRAILRRFATYVGSDPRRAPATLNCIAWVELGLGGYGVRGGIDTLVAALVRVALRAGVAFRLGEPVERIEVAHGRVVGVRTPRGTVRANVVVANGEPASVLAGLDGEGGVLEPPSSTSGFTCVVRARRRPRVAHEVWFPDDVDREVRELFDDEVPPSSPTLYVCAEEVAHGRSGWPDHEVLFVMTGAPREPAAGSDPECWNAVRDGVVSRLRAVGACTEEDEVVWERTPRDLARRFPGSGGALYGAAAHGALSAFRRPANRVQGVRGLYLAGGGAHPGGGLPLCASSGRAAADAALEDFA